MKTKIMDFLRKSEVISSSQQMQLKILKALSLTLFVFGFAGWVYIALNAQSHPETLPLPLTHLAPWPREDTFGIICFGTSFVSFFVWNLVKEK